MKRSKTQSFNNRRSPSGWLVALGALSIALAGILINFQAKTGFSSIEGRSQQSPVAEISIDRAVKRYADDESGLGHAPLYGEELKLRRGDTLLGLLHRRGLRGDSARELIAAMRLHLDPKTLRPGERIDLLVSDDRAIRGLEYLNGDHLLRVSATDLGWKAEQTTIPSLKEMRTVRGTVTDSLYENGTEAGLTPNQIMELAAIFEYDIDFFSDFHRGDEFSVLFDETRYEDGRREIGAIVAAEVQSGDEQFRIFRFTDKTGKAGYYNGDGMGRRRAFLRAPLSFTRISSRFNPKRRHPIFRTLRPHLAIDYAAPAGTPVVALGNGRVSFSGWKGGYGNMVEVRHANGYATRYAHFSKIAAKMRPGRQVSQGQVVGYVGQTGHATGPHLHFEMLRNGRKINFLGLRIPTSEKLRGKELQRFMKERETTLALLEGKSTLMAHANDCPGQAQQNC